MPWNGGYGMSWNPHHTMTCRKEGRGMGCHGTLITSWDVGRKEGVMGCHGTLIIPRDVGWKEGLTGCHGTLITSWDVGRKVLWDVMEPSSCHEMLEGRGYGMWWNPHHIMRCRETGVMGCHGSLIIPWDVGRKEGVMGCHGTLIIPWDVGKKEGRCYRMSGNPHHTMRCRMEGVMGCHGTLITPWDVGRKVLWDVMEPSSHHEM